MVEINPDREDILELMVHRATAKVESDYYMLRRASLKSFLAVCGICLALLGFSGWAAVRATMKTALGEAMRESGARAAIDELNTYRESGQAAAKALERLVAEAERAPAVAFFAYLGKYQFLSRDEHAVKFGLDERSGWPYPSWKDDETYVIPLDGVYLLQASFNRDTDGGTDSGDVYVRVRINDQTDALVAWAGQGEHRKAGFGYRVASLKRGDRITVHATWHEPAPEAGVTYIIRELSVSGLRIGALPPELYYPPDDERGSEGG